ncbi:hypothetical protein KFE25_013116 [Diacronema lutheri]|uniref:Uncharacterized protein n=1 Tax=Diacronema lutheri TaxID=2081491 RepID=A0A8J5X461_DIALT|nr:hypothetical protein KFE25_013116 [Diacronema lutheri]
MLGWGRAREAEGGMGATPQGWPDLELGPPLPAACELWTVGAGADVERGPPPHVELALVCVRKLRAALGAAPGDGGAARVLDSLATSTELLVEPRDALGLPFALVSYRQEARPGDAHRLDARALAGIVLAAERLRVHAVWLDAWCFRQPGPYDHRLFVATLSDVVTHMAAVVWLPRSRTDVTLGTYQHRLWTTLEAIAVVSRSVPVAIAGVGLSRFQRRLAALGSLTPLLPGDARIVRAPPCARAASAGGAPKLRTAPHAHDEPIGELARLNGAFYASAPLLTLLRALDAAAATSAGDAADGRACMAAAVAAGARVCASLCALWLVLRALVPEQTLLASHGARVLGAMVDAARAPAGTPTGASARAARRAPAAAAANARANARAAELLGEMHAALPTLPCLDRIDAVTVKQLANALAAGRARATRAARRAPLARDARDAAAAVGEGAIDLEHLIFASYWSARLEPTQHASLRGARSPLEWLRARGVPPPLRGLGTSWLEATHCTTGAAADCLAVRQLRLLGWRFVTAPTPRLSCPLGDVTGLAVCSTTALDAPRGARELCMADAAPRAPWARAALRRGGGLWLLFGAFACGEVLAPVGAAGDARVLTAVGASALRLAALVAALCAAGLVCAVLVTDLGRELRVRPLPAPLLPAPQGAAEALLFAAALCTLALPTVLALSVELAGGSERETRAPSGAPALAALGRAAVDCAEYAPPWARGAELRVEAAAALSPASGLVHAAGAHGALAAARAGAARAGAVWACAWARSENARLVALTLALRARLYACALIAIIVALPLAVHTLARALRAGRAAARGGGDGDDGDASWRIG